MSRVRMVSLLLLATACEGPQFAQFDPLPADVATERAVRAHFSMPVPKGWASSEGASSEDGDVLTARETPPANGRIRAYRTMLVKVVDAVPGDDEAARRSAALGVLRSRYAEDGLAEVTTGHGQLAGRDSAWLFGSIFRGSIDTRFDVLAHVIPCRDHALLVEFATPAGQFENARAGFAALANGLETDLAPPRGSGPLAWFGGRRIGLRADDWSTALDVDGCAAVFAQEGTSARGELHVLDAGGAKVLDAAIDADDGPSRTRASIERGRRDGRSYVRLRSVQRDGARVLFVDELFAAEGQRLEHLRFVVPVAEWGKVATAVDRVMRSVRWRE